MAIYLKANGLFWAMEKEWPDNGSNAGRVAVFDALIAGACFFAARR